MLTLAQNHYSHLAFVVIFRIKPRGQGGKYTPEKWASFWLTGRLARCGGQSQQ